MAKDVLKIVTKKSNHQESNATVVRKTNHQLKEGMINSQMNSSKSEVDKKIALEKSDILKINPTIILKDYKVLEYSTEIILKNSSLKKTFIVIPDNTSELKN